MNKALIFSLCVFFFHAVSALTDLVKNGDFTLNVISPWAYSCPSQWTCSGAVVTISSSTSTWASGPAPSGTYFVGLQGTSTYIMQDIAVVRGMTYTFNFYARNRPEFQKSQLSIYLGNSLIWGPQTLTYSSWTLYSFTYKVPTSVRGSLGLKFLNSGCVGDCTLMVDKIQMWALSSSTVPSPRPSTLSPTIWRPTFGTAPPSRDPSRHGRHGKHDDTVPIDDYVRVGDADDEGGDGNGGRSTAQVLFWFFIGVMNVVFVGVVGGGCVYVYRRRRAGPAYVVPHQVYQLLPNMDSST